MPTAEIWALTGLAALQLHLPAFEWAPRWRPAWPVALQAVLVALLVVQAVRLMWLLAVAPAPLGEVAAVQAAEDAPVAAAAPADPFFPASGQARPAADASGLVLYGISAAPAGRSAILGKAQGAQASYRVSEQPAPGVSVVRIESDHVVLQANGARSRLEFGTADASPIAARALPSAAPAAAAGSAPAVDPEQLLAQAGLDPVTENGRVTGYTLIPRGDGALLRQAGLQAGDVILAVNGQTLTPERYRALAEDLSGASKIDIRFRRGGETRSISLQAKTP